MVRPLLVAVLVPVMLFLAVCDDPGPRNTAPTVVITDGPTGVHPADTASFTWQGSDADGELVGYRWWLDDSLTAVETADTGVSLSGLSSGESRFHVQAVDDSGARSLPAVRAFRVVYDSAITPRGVDSCLEIVTWNIENFPKASDSTLNRVQAAILRLGFDFYGIQEIQDTLAFIRLLAGLPGYAGLWSRDSYGSFYMKTGVIYKREMFVVSRVRPLFWNNDSVTRPPLEMSVSATHNGRTLDFKLIVLHLKAGRSGADFAQRRATCRLLKEYIDGEVARGVEERFVVIGDWNERLDEPRETNSLQAFIDDSLGYQFLTWPFRSSSYHATHIPSSRVIDHLMMTAGVGPDYEGGRTETIRLDDEMAGYLAVMSDHRPVASWFPVFGAGR
ncbi:MAG TPA: hypothetical protein ENN51_04405 [candidate division WOR-3 bacterium]|mgnify:CR=1 FL=1|uniref:Endonuclease/exonuclease/phosphatase domain-containing protein n=1 Tax=candidate division WOR-3 bacterium TaxID=2052148 RepID=A0A7V0T5F6_UNCW3|nr:hypothetical protein [candidate division WOR-3 bacterium]